MEQPTLVNLEIAKCFESPTNPRGTVFEKTPFAELVASIKESGVLQPVLARLIKGKYEIVAGSRRLRAAKEAGLLFIPAQVRPMTDIEAREAQIVENLQRADIHPIDEAFAYRDLIENSKPRLDTKGVAAKVGKSDSYVRNRLALASLDKKYADKVRSGELPVGHAVIIARLDLSSQAKAYKEAMSWNDADGVIPLNKLRAFVQEMTFDAAMKNPPWKNDDQASAEIARITGTGGGAPTLFGEKAADVFDNPADYAVALAAYIRFLIDKFRADGKPLTLVADTYWIGDKSKALKRGDYDLVSSVKGCKSGHDAIIVEGDQVGKMLRVCIDKKCPAHHVSEKRSPTHKSKAETPAEKKAREAREKREEMKKAKERKTFTDAIGKVKWPLSEKHLGVLFTAIIESDDYYLDQIAEQYGIVGVEKKEGRHTTTEYKAAVLKYFEALGNVGKIQVVMAFVILDKCYGDKEKAKTLASL